MLIVSKTTKVHVCTVYMYIFLFQMTWTVSVILNAYSNCLQVSSLSKQLVFYMSFVDSFEDTKQLNNVTLTDLLLRVCEKELS